MPCWTPAQSPSGAGGLVYPTLSTKRDELWGGHKHHNGRHMPYIHPLLPCCFLLLHALGGHGAEISVGDYHKIIARNGEYAEPIVSPFQWMADNLLDTKGANLAKALLQARQIDLDGDGKTELIITSLLVVGHGETPNYVFKVTESGDAFNYIGELGVSGGRIGAEVDNDGSRVVVTTYRLGKFYVCYHVNNGRKFTVKRRKEYNIEGGIIVGLPEEVRKMFPHLDPGQ